MAIFSFSRIVVCLFVLLMAYWGYNIYKITVTTSCKKGQNCIKPLYPMSKTMKLTVFVSPKKDASRVAHNIQLLSLTNFMRNESISRESNATLPLSTINNGTLFAHIFVGPDSLLPDQARNYGRFKVITVPLTKYLPPSKTEFNLVTGGEYESITANESTDPVSHWVPILDIRGVAENWEFDYSSVPYELILTGSLSLTEGRTAYYPIISCKNMKVFNRDLLRITVDNVTMPLTVSYTPVGLGQFRIWMQFLQSLKAMDKLGFPEKEVDTVKELLFGNLYLLMLTFFVSAFHLLFDFLAFKNDINFWRKRKTTIGLSRRTMLWRCFSSTVVTLYLMEEVTSMLILVPTAIGTVIEFWKLKKALKVTITLQNGLPRIKFKQQLSSEKETDNYDSQAMKYLSFLLIPLVIVGSIYCLLFLKYKSWYSWLIHTLVNGVYTFGFLFMLPQLFVNYKLKSVAHLPWRAFMYKAFNTFIDDIFAFIITMPTTHRVAVFRDDLVFLVYLYQRWLYPVDRNRVNEFGESFDVDSEKKDN